MHCIHWKRYDINLAANLACDSDWNGIDHRCNKSGIDLTQIAAQIWHQSEIKPRQPAINLILGASSSHQHYESEVGQDSRWKTGLKQIQMNPHITQRRAKTCGHSSLQDCCCTCKSFGKLKTKPLATHCQQVSMDVETQKRSWQNAMLPIWLLLNTRNQHVSDSGLLSSWNRAMTSCINKAQVATNM